LGHFVFLANAADGLRIYDVADASNPINIGHTNNSTALRAYASSVAVCSNLVYLANGTDGLRIYDVSDLANPINIGHTNNGYASAVVASGGRAFLDDGGLRVHDVSDPSIPISTGITSLAAVNVEDLAISGDHVCMASSGAGLKIFNVPGLGNPVQVGSIFSGGFARDVAISGQYAYLANGYDGLRVYDVSNPAQPVEVGHVNNGGYAQGVAVSGHHVYLANGGDGLRIYAVRLQLKMHLTGTNTLFFSWPAPAAFVLQQNHSLVPGDWVTVTNLPCPVGSQCWLTLPALDSNMFYRLVSP